VTIRKFLKVFVVLSLGTRHALIALTIPTFLMRMFLKQARFLFFYLSGGVDEVPVVLPYVEQRGLEA
jgi:hypothetical protein